MSLGLYKEQVQMRFGLGTGSGGEALGVSRYDKYAKMDYLLIWLLRKAVLIHCSLMGQMF